MVKLLLIVFLLSSCLGQRGNYKPPKNLTQDEYFRDSIFFCHTVSEFIEYEIETFYHEGLIEQFFKKLHKMSIETGTKIKYMITVDSIFYSPDKLKFVAVTLISHTLKENASFPEDYLYFSGYTLIGYRDSLTQPWKVYPFNISIGSQYRDIESLREHMYKSYTEYLENRGFFFYVKDKEKFKKRGYDVDRYTINDNVSSYSDNNISLKFGYNVGDPEFWTQGSFFIKGLGGVDSLYPFETYTTNKILDEGRIMARGISYFKEYKPLRSLKEKWEKILGRDYNGLLKQAQEESSDGKVDTAQITMNWQKKRNDTYAEFTARTYEESSNGKVDSLMIYKAGLDEFTRVKKYKKITYPDTLLQMYYNWDEEKKSWGDIQYEPIKYQFYPLEKKNRR